MTRPARLRTSKSSIRKPSRLLALDEMADEFLALGAQLRSVILGQEIAECLERAQRLLEVVRDDIGKIVQFVVDAPQLLVGMAQFLGLPAQGVGQPVALGDILGGAARTKEMALGVLDGHRANPDVDGGAVLLDPLGLDLAGLLERIGPLPETLPAFRRQEAGIRLVDQLLAG